MTTSRATLQKAKSNSRSIILLGDRLKTDDALCRYVLAGAQQTGNELGTGSYGSVEEIKVNGLLCAGKIIHQLLLDPGNEGAEAVAEKYIKECKLMSDLRHPNITQFLGICYFDESPLPVLIMEKLYCSLDDILESTPNIPLTLKCCMLEDVARGLLYLHNYEPQIVHRDLSAKNVLLTTSFLAKITDLGNSRIVNIQPGQLAKTLSRFPGTLSYMPPEADTSKYDTSLDVFSFGHLGLFTGLQVFPGTLKQATFQVGDNHLGARSEVERRQEYFDQLEAKLPGGGKHPLVILIKKCLSNSPIARPSAGKILSFIQDVKKGVEGPYDSHELMRANVMKEVMIARNLRQRDTEMKMKNNEIQQLERELKQTEESLKNLREEMKIKDTPLSEAENSQLQREARQARQWQQELKQAESTLENLRVEIYTKDRQLVEKETTIENMHVEIRIKDNQLKEKEKELLEANDRLAGEEQKLGQTEATLEYLQGEIHTKDTQLKEKEKKLQEANNRLAGEVKKLRQTEATLEYLQREIHTKDTQLKEKEKELQEARLASNRELQNTQTHPGPRPQPLDSSLIYEPMQPTYIQTEVNSAYSVISGFDRQKISIGKKIGSGVFGEVWQAVWNNTTVAMKQLKRGVIPIAKFPAQEAEKLMKMSHCNLLKTYAICTRMEPILILSEFMKKGSLLTYLQSEEGKRLNLTQLINIAMQIAAGMAYLEQQDYVHGSLAARNVFMGEHLTCKIGDIGIARIIYSRTEAQVGYIKRTAPEAIKLKKFSIKSDVWSFGVLLYEIVTYGRIPYPGMNNRQVFDRVVQGYRMPKSIMGGQCTDKLYEMMLNCWKDNPALRLTFNTIEWQLEDTFENLTAYEFLPHQEPTYLPLK